MKDDLAEIPFRVFSADGHCEGFWNGRGCPLFDVVHPERHIHLPLIQLLDPQLVVVRSTWSRSAI